MWKLKVLTDDSEIRALASQYMMDSFSEAEAIASVFRCFGYLSEISLA